jgi:GNAT superfamily N-acetyltransferase
VNQPQFQIVNPSDNKLIELISEWYLTEWNIAKDKTIKRLKSFSHDCSQFQVLMTLDAVPIATGGLYNHVSLLDKEPRFKVYKNWLALVYTIPDKRHQGFGSLICDYIQDYLKRRGVKEMFLFTDTAEKLYTRLGWNVLERLSLDERNIVVMKKQL